MKIQDPDELIHEIAWKGIHEIEQLCLAFQRIMNCCANIYR